MNHQRVIPPRHLPTGPKSHYPRNTPEFTSGNSVRQDQVRESNSNYRAHNTAGGVPIHDNRYSGQARPHSGWNAHAPSTSHYTHGSPTSLPHASIPNVASHARGNVQTNSNDYRSSHFAGNVQPQTFPNDHRSSHFSGNGQFQTPQNDHRSSHFRGNGQFQTPQNDHRSSHFRGNGQFQNPPNDRRSSHLRGNGQFQTPQNDRRSSNFRGNGQFQTPQNDCGSSHPGWNGQFQASQNDYRSSHSGWNGQFQTSPNDCRSSHPGGNVQFQASQNDIRSSHSRWNGQSQTSQNDHRSSHSGWNGQFQTFPRGDTAPVQAHQQSIPIARVPYSLPIAPRTDNSHNLSLKASEETALPVWGTKPGGTFPFQSQGTSISVTSQNEDSEFNGEEKEQDRGDIPREWPKMGVMGWEKSGSNVDQLQENRPVPFQDPLAPPSTVTPPLGSVGTETATRVPVVPAPTTTTPTLTKPAVPSEKPSKNRKKNPTNISRTATEGDQPRKNSRKKKAEGVESIKCEDEQDEAFVMAQLERGVEKPQRKKKKQKVDDEVQPNDRGATRPNEARSTAGRVRMSHSDGQAATTRLPSTSKSMDGDNQLRKPARTGVLGKLNFKKNKKTPDVEDIIAPNQPKITQGEEKTNDFNDTQPEDNRPETVTFVPFQGPMPPPTCVGAETAVAVQLIESTLPTMTTPSAIEPIDPSKKPYQKRKKDTASISETAEGDKKPLVKKPRKKKAEAGENDGGATVDKPLRKRKKKADGEVVNTPNVDPTSAAGTSGVQEQASEMDKNPGGETDLNPKDKKTSGRGRKRKKPGDDSELAGSSRKKRKKVKVEDEEEMGGGEGEEGGGEDVDDPISGNNAITGEWARKRTKSLKSSSHVRWTVLGTSKASKAGSKSKRVVHSADIPVVVTPERILRPNIWTASKSELVFVLPELSQSRSHNGVTEGSSNFPMVLLDESTADSIGFQVEKSSGEGSYGTVRLTLVRDFVCPLEEVMGRESNLASTSATVVHPQQQEEDPDDSGLEYIDEPIPSMENMPVLAPIPPSHEDPMTLPSPATLANQNQPQILPNAPHQVQPQLSLTESIPILPFTPPSPMTLISATNNPPFQPEINIGSTLPRTLPPEIDILTSTCSLSLPIILISSKEVFHQAFVSNSPGIRPTTGLGEEHAYVFLGFFKFREGNGNDGRGRVVTVWNVKVEGEGEGEANANKVGGRVEWVFELEWVPGWDGSKNGGATRPWWGDVIFGGEGGEEKVSVRDAQVQRWLNLNLLPAQIVDGQEEGSADEAMPRGWLCKTCGRLNQKVMMRHRWCGGVTLKCRDNSLSQGYAVELWDARDPMQTALALPINVCDENQVDVRVADWDDGMRTLKYRPMTLAMRQSYARQEEIVDLSEGRGILKHVFTCNAEELQSEATPLFGRIQRDVCLSKKIGDSGPYFKCDISNSYASKRDKFAFSCMTWEKAPQVVHDVQDLMVHMGKSYGEDQDLVVNRLTIIGWVASGTRKASEKVSSKDHTVAMMCLGNDVILTITPKWEVEEGQETPTGTSLRLMVSGNVDAGVAPETWQKTDTRTHDHERVISAQTESNPAGDSVGVPAGKKSKGQDDLSRTSQTLSMSVTLVHGDMLLFSGCDFEYSIKRLGTSIHGIKKVLVGGKT